MNNNGGSVNPDFVTFFILSYHEISSSKMRYNTRAFLQGLPPNSDPSAIALAICNAKKDLPTLASPSNTTTDGRGIIPAHKKSKSSRSISAYSDAVRQYFSDIETPGRGNYTRASNIYYTHFIYKSGPLRVQIQPLSVYN